jgi:hypothetical protein
MSLQEKVDLTHDSADFFELEDNYQSQARDPTLDSFTPSARRFSQSAPNSSRTSPVVQSPRRQQPQPQPQPQPTARAQPERKKADEASMCTICKTQTVACAAIPCGHVFCCVGCSHELLQRRMACSICRANVTRYQRLYFV